MIRALRLETEKKLLMTQLQQEVNTFDENLDILAADKIQLEYEIKIASMKLITFYQELIILEAFEQKDNEYLEKLEEQKAALNELNSKRADLLNANTTETDNQKALLMKLKECEASYNEKIFPNNKEKAAIVYTIFKMQQKAKEEKDMADDDMDGMDGEFDPDYDDVSTYHRTYFNFGLGNCSTVRLGDTSMGRGCSE